MTLPLDLFSPVGDEGKVAAAWRDVVSPSPLHLSGLLDDPKTAERVRSFFVELVNEYVQSLRDDEAAPCTAIGSGL